MAHDCAIMQALTQVGIASGSSRRLPSLRLRFAANSYIIWVDPTSKFTFDVPEGWAMLQCGCIAGTNTKASPEPDTLFGSRVRPRAVSLSTTDLAALECHLPRCKSFR